MRTSACMTTAFWLVLLSFACLSGGFVVIPSPSRKSPIVQQSTSLLVCHAKAGNKKKRNAPGGKKKQKNKKRSNNKSLSEKASQRASVVLPGVKSRAPPWQVLSAKDAKANVEKERQRRELARQGLQPIEHQQQEDQQLKSKALLSDANQRLLNWKRPTKVPCGMTFIGSYLEKRLPPRLGVPEVAFLGRSNVGKSSLLNRLSASAKGAKFASDQARVGKTPGATASVNLYAMLAKQQNDGVTRPILGLADLPGFGYAKLSKDVKESVQQAAERYLEKRQELALGILLVDARRAKPSNDDRAILAALYDMGVPLVVVATKVDKLSKTEVEPSLETIRQGLGLPEGQPLCVSSVTGEGIKDLWKIILEACEVRVEELREKLELSKKVDDDEKEYETVQLDDEGNPLLLDDGEDVAYDQGYDWVHDSAVMYEGDDEDYAFENEEDDWEYDDDDFGTSKEDDDVVSEDAFKLKNLRKRARGMERRGEL